jgi:hypothetical protein
MRQSAIGCARVQRHYALPLGAESQMPIYARKESFALFNTAQSRTNLSAEKSLFFTDKACLQAQAASIG